MGKKALQYKNHACPVIRGELLSDEERAFLRARVSYEGSSVHKRNPGDFRLTPPAAPRPDKTLCDEASVFREAEAQRLFELAIEQGLVSENFTPGGFPKRMWCVDEGGRVFEAMHGGVSPGVYHGYPIRESNQLFDRVTNRLRPCES